MASKEEYSRRDALKILGGAGAMGLAGCTSNNSDADQAKQTETPGNTATSTQTSYSTETAAETTYDTETAEPADTTREPADETTTESNPEAAERQSFNDPWSMLVNPAHLEEAGAFTKAGAYNEEKGNDQIRRAYKIWEMEDYLEPLSQQEIEHIKDVVPDNTVSHGFIGAEITDVITEVTSMNLGVARFDLDYDEIRAELEDRYEKSAEHQGRDIYGGIATLDRGPIEESYEFLIGHKKGGDEITWALDSLEKTQLFDNISAAYSVMMDTADDKKTSLIEGKGNYSELAKEAKKVTDEDADLTRFVYERGSERPLGYLSPYKNRGETVYSPGTMAFGVDDSGEVRHNDWIDAETYSDPAVPLNDEDQ